MGRMLRLDDFPEQGGLRVLRTGVEQLAAGEDAGVGVELVGIGTARAHDMHDLNAPGNQGVRDQPAMAAPGHGFCAQDRDRLASGALDQPLQSRLELWRLHVVRVAAEGFDAPGGVGRVGPGGTAAAEAGLMNVPDAGFGQGGGQGVARVLGMSPGAGEAPEGREGLGRVLGAQGQEVFDGARGVANGEDGRHPGYYIAGLGPQPMWRSMNCCFE